jgi:hypothetical protein
MPLPTRSNFCAHSYFVAARRMMEDDKLQVRREFEETAAMLKETARKHMQAEGTKGDT